MLSRSLLGLAISTSVLSAFITLCVAQLPDGRPHGNVMRVPVVPPMQAPSVPVVSRNGEPLPPYETIYYFDQLVDHNNPSLGTFEQRFWFTSEFYEPRGPIILYTPGEANALRYTGYLTNVTLPGMIAQQENGANVVLEHRFYGESNPYPDLSVPSFRVHTIQQAIDDLEYFAKNVELPMTNGDNLTPDQAPWILVGGSYAGALVSWTMVDKPGVFFAGYSSSGVVQATIDYWKYFEPVRQFMPQNCSADVQRVVAHLDEVFRIGNETEVSNIKDNFGLFDLVQPDDVLSALRNNLWDWQLMQPGSGPGHRFYQFCDALEVKDGISAPAQGWGLDHALNAWGLYWRTRYYSQLCGFQDSEACLGTFDTTLPVWSDISVDNAWRSWFWIVCNEVGYLQNGAPASKPSLVSRRIQPPYDLRQCQLMFPTAFSSTPEPKVAVINRKYKGWDVKVDQVIFVDGARDPWRDAGLSAGLRTPLVRGTSLQPVYLTNGFHCSDLPLKGAVDPTIAYARQKSLGHMKTWLKTFKPKPRSNWPRPPRPNKPNPRPGPSSPRKDRFKKKTGGAWFRGAEKN